MSARRRSPVRRMRMPRRLSWPGLVLLVIVALLAWWRSKEKDQPEAPPPDVLIEGEYQVERVVDGDTLALANGAKVRLIGVDTPETVKPNHPVEPWGPEATQFTEQFVAGGKVRLEFDRERKDHYGRHLAYVYVDDRMLNEALIQAGVGRAETEYRFSTVMKRRFLKAQEEAQAAGRGIWSKPAGRKKAA